MDRLLHMKVCFQEHPLFRFHVVYQLFEIVSLYNGAVIYSGFNENGKSNLDKSKGLLTDHTIF